VKSGHALEVDGHFASVSSGTAVVGCPGRAGHTSSEASAMATTVDARPEWLPEGYEHVQVTREEVWNELDRDARRLFGLTADEFLRIFRNPPEQYHGDVRFRSLCHVADLIAEPDDV